ncbi:MAG: type II toxin-antitoxin system RelE/ParE family toxin [Cyanobacterium sp. T60_A2020_053]|nr:type II toxin-antitoxin system RelE/ParE family toxin [Cyanobacterium sp. T60_A2020_053]
MIEYQIKFKSSTVKEFKNLPSSMQKRIGDILEKMKQNPRTSGVLKLKGDSQLYRVRVGDYRIIFNIDDEQKLVKVTRIRHRQDVYKK